MCKKIHKKRIEKGAVILYTEYNSNLRCAGECDVRQSIAKEDT